VPLCPPQSHGFSWDMAWTLAAISRRMSAPAVMRSQSIKRSWKNVCTA